MGLRARWWDLWRVVRHDLVGPPTPFPSKDMERFAALVKLRARCARWCTIFTEHPEIPATDKRFTEFEEMARGFHREAEALREWLACTAAELWELVAHASRTTHEEG